MKKRKRSVFIFVFLSAALWMGGFLFFIYYTTSFRPTYASADAIIVLTGGSLRVKEGVRLLKENHAKKLLISGVAFGIKIDQLFEEKEIPIDIRKKIDIDSSAYNTTSNAIETAYWMKKHAFTSAILVTAHYHLPRSMVNFKYFMPDLQIIPHPVFPMHVKLDQWWRYPGTTQLLITEFHKYIGAKLFSIMGLGPLYL